MKNLTVVFLALTLVTTCMVSQVNDKEYDINIKQVNISTLSRDYTHLILKVEQSTIMRDFSLYFLFKWNATTGIAVQWVDIPKVKDLDRNLTVFTLDMILPISWNGASFPQDAYILTAYLGSNYKFDGETSLLGWPSLDFPNFEASLWTMNYLGNYTDLIEELGTSLVGSDPSDVGNSWCKFRVGLRRTEDFSHHANLMVNYVPATLYVFVFCVFLFPLVLLCQSIMQRKRYDRKADFIEKMVVPIYVGVILFIPIFQLSIQPIKAPFSSIDQDFRLFTLFTLSVIFLLISVFIRFFIRPEMPCNTDNGEDSSSDVKEPPRMKRVSTVSTEARWMFDTQRESIMTWFIASVTIFIGMVELLPEIRNYSSIYLMVLLATIYVVLLFFGVLCAQRVLYLVERRMMMEQRYLPEHTRMTIWGQHQRPFKWLYKFSEDGTFRSVNWTLVYILLVLWCMVWTSILLLKLGLF